MTDLETRIVRARDGSSRDRLALVRELLPAGLAPDSVVRTRVTPATSGSLPAVLTSFFAIVPTWSPGSGQNHILDPSELYVADGKLVFAVENQGVYYWATDASGDDPPVFGRFEATDPWLAEEPSLSMFLLQFMLFEWLMASRRGASVAWVDRAKLDVMLADLTPLQLPDWRWPSYPGRFHARANALAFECPNGDGVWSFWIGAEGHDDLVFMKPHVQADWEHADL